MHSTIRKWGNSLGLRIPRAFADELGLEDGTTIDLSLQGGHLIIRAVHPNDAVLQNLLDRVKDDQLHGEIDTGPPRGGEHW